MEPQLREFYTGVSSILPTTQTKKKHKAAAVDPSKKDEFRPIYRKMQMDSWIRKQQIEAQIIRATKEKFGDDAILLMGDWSKNGTHNFNGLAPNP